MMRDVGPSGSYYLYCHKFSALCRWNLYLNECEKLQVDSSISENWKSSGFRSIAFLIAEENLFNYYLQKKFDFWISPQVSKIGIKNPTVRRITAATPRDDDAILITEIEFETSRCSIVKSKSKSKSRWLSCRKVTQAA